MKTCFLIIIILHGLIHMLGFVKAYEIAEISSLANYISKPVGWLWLIAAVLFLTAAVNFKMNKEWISIAIVAIILSQVLISLAWSDARFGTLANIIILAVVVISLLGRNFKNSFYQDAAASILRSDKAAHETLVNNDIMHLPVPVQKYLHYADVVGKPKLRNMKVVMSGRMRGKDKKWFSFNSIQYNTFDKMERLFFMDATVNNLPTKGYHYFKDGQAKMNIKVLSAFPVVSESGELLKKAETVTLFNDMCIMAPTTLIYDNIQWEEISDNEVLAHFTNDGITISATLYFDNEGALVNFYSDDRIDVKDNKSYGFSTPISNYEDVNGYMKPTYGEAIWHYPEEEFVYGKFDIKSITYNIKRVQK